MTQNKTQTLALEFRPKVWSEVVGQELPVDVLTNAIMLDDIKPGYLFEGHTGCGKTSVALLLAKRLLCEKPNLADPCNECHSCKTVDRGTNADLRYIDGAEDRSVNFIRNILKPYLSSAPLSGRRRIAIIDEAHLYGKDAIASFLTLLEQMPVHSPKSVIIFCTTEGDDMLPTIVNRCLSLSFNPIPPDLIAKSMARVTGCPEDALRLLAAEANGSFRTMWSFIEVWQHTGRELNEEMVMKITRGVTSKERQAMWADLSSSRSDQVVARWNRWLQNGGQPKVIMKYMLKDLHQIAAANPGSTSWIKPLAILSNATQTGPESTYLSGLLRLCGLPLVAQDGNGPSPAERQPVSSSQTAGTYLPDEDYAAQRLLFFGA